MSDFEETYFIFTVYENSRALKSTSDSRHDISVIHTLTGALGNREWKASGFQTSPGH